MEAERDAGQDSDLGVGGLDEGVRQVLSDRGLDGLPVAADLAAEVDERGDAAAGGPGQPSVEGFDAGAMRDFTERMRDWSRQMAERARSGDASTPPTPASSMPPMT